MNKLPQVHTWFFESIRFESDATLFVELVEGVKSDKKELVQVDENTTLGPYFSVKVRENSRIVSVQFPDVFTYEVLDESFDIGDEKIKINGTYLSICSQSSYLDSIKDRTSIDETEVDFIHYLLWSEEFLVNIITKRKPIISQLEKEPNLKKERTTTYSAI